MRLALIGKSISHSTSPHLYKRIIGPQIHYDLIDIQKESDLPPLSELAKNYHGINLTSPYKKFYLDQLNHQSEEVLKLGATNTISLKPNDFLGVNTDYLATETILRRFREDYPSLFILILGSGVMANLTKLLCENLSLRFLVVSRKTSPDLAQLNLKKFHQVGNQLLVINACSRDFIFEGEASGDEFFWDYNYKFLPHQNTLPFKVKSYWDGQEMLYLQAYHAANFWREHWP